MPQAGERPRKQALQTAPGTQPWAPSKQRQRDVGTSSGCQVRVGGREETVRYVKETLVLIPAVSLTPGVSLASCVPLFVFHSN